MDANFCHGRVFCGQLCGTFKAILQLITGFTQMSGLKIAAMASVLMLTAGSMAWAQGSMTTPGAQTNPNASSPSAWGQSSASNVSADTQQKIRQSLEQSGFKNIQVLPEAYVIRAQAPDGSHIAMLLSPDQVTEVVTGSANSGTVGNPGMLGNSAQAYGARSSWQGSGSSMMPSQQQAQQELSRYGYTNLSDLKPVQAWAADATKDGEAVHVILSDNNLVATFQGR
jgi:hypothetical protein